MADLLTDGYQIIRDVFTPDEVALLREEVEGVLGKSNTACVRHLRSQSRLLDELSLSRKVLDLLPLGLSPVRSILFDKTAAANWPVPWHQDLTISVVEEMLADGYGPWSIKDGVVHVQPPADLLKQMATVRIHLDETNQANGALRVIPKSHLLGKLSSKEVLSSANESEVACECAAGDVLLMSPLILHASSKSEQPNRRRIIHFEYAPKGALVPELSWHESEVAFEMSPH